MSLDNAESSNDYSTEYKLAVPQALPAFAGRFDAFDPDCDSRLFTPQKNSLR